jgi:aspartyl-tRNA synthetase
MSSDDASAGSAPAAPPAAPAAAADGAAKEPKKLTAKELRVIEKQKAAEAAAVAAAAAEAEAARLNADVYGELPLIQSQAHTDRVWTRVADLSGALAGEGKAPVLVRARVHAVRETSKVLFLTLRQAFSTVQATVFKGTNKDLFKFAAALPKESVVDVRGALSKVEAAITSCTQSDVELSVATLFVVSRANPVLPFQLEDAARPDRFFDEQAREEAEALAAGKPPPERKFVSVSQDTRLDYRWIDLRTPANQAIMRISSGVCQLFREFLSQRDFVEIQTPKILGGASEGGSSVFQLKYFGADACLAQSPQLYKQMTAACSDLERVFEIGPVFRAENSNTHRHLCEFHGLDMEMVINEHYYEVLDVFSDLFIFIFDGMKARYAREMEAVRAQHPFEDLEYCRPSLRITYAEGVAMLQAAGVAINPGDDFSTAQERALGAIIKEKYHTDFFMMDRYPTAIRPFYTMPCPDDPTLSNSYDFFIRGEEIVSGAQRVHEPELLTRQAREKGVPPESIKSYIDSFRHGALPHGGGGVGLERVVMLSLGLANIRKACMFVRDPKRLAP